MAVSHAIGWAFRPLPITMVSSLLFPHEVPDVEEVNPERGGSELAVRELRSPQGRYLRPPAALAVVGSQPTGSRLLVRAALAT